MNTESKTYFVEGEYDDIVFEIERELITWNERQSEGKLASEVIPLCAKMAAEVLIRQEEANEDHKYEKGVIIPNRKYYLKFDLSLLIAIACAIGHILAIIVETQNPSGSALSIGQNICTVGETIGFNGALREIPEEHFCVLICAHHNKNGKYISVETIEDRLYMKECPYMELFKAAYGHTCKKRINNKCPLSAVDIRESMDQLGLAFDVTEVVDGHLYDID